MGDLTPRTFSCRTTWATLTRWISGTMSHCVILYWDILGYIGVYCIVRYCMILGCITLYFIGLHCVADKVDLGRAK